MAFIVALVVAVGAFLIFNKTLLEHRRAELEIRSRSGSSEGEKSMTQSELVELIREAVHAENEELAERIDAVEQRLERLLDSPRRGAGFIPAAGEEEEEARAAGAKTMGRRRET